MANMVATATEVTFDTVKKIKFEWLSDDSAGTATVTTDEVYTGKILGLATVPGLSGDQPDDNYDITVTDGDSLDVLMGGGANRDETDTEYVLSTSLGAVVASALTINVSGAGNANTGVAYVYIR